MQVHRAIIKAYDAVTHKADVQLVSSLPTLVLAVPVATDIPAADVVADRECAVLFFTDDNPDDAVIITVQGALPAAGLDVEVLESGVSVGTVGATLTLIEVYEGGVLVGGTP